LPFARCGDVEKRNLSQSFSSGCWQHIKTYRSPIFCADFKFSLPSGFEQKKFGGNKMKGKFVLTIGLVFFVSVMMFAIAASRDAVAGVVGMWLLDDGKGDTAIDSSGGGHDAEIFDGKWVDGMFKKGIEFGATTHMEVPDHKDFHFTDKFTIELWANLEDLPKDHVGIPGKGHDLAVGSFVFHPTKLSAEEFELRFYISIGGAWPAVTASAIPFGEWHHLAGTYDGSELKVYVDGELAASGAQEGNQHLGGRAF